MGRRRGRLGALVLLCTCTSCGCWDALPAQTATRAVRLHNLWDREVPYHTALEWQRELHRERAEAVRAGVAPPQDALLLLQHPPVYTLGTGSTLDHVRGPTPFELVRTERGGEVTYHGPGQLVLYPVLDLRGYQQDAHWYMGALEEVAIRTLASVGLEAHREAGLPGVWVGGAKVCACGVKLSRWVTMHGLALNVCPELSHYDAIVPCGIADRGVTSLQELLPAADARARMAHVQPLLLRHFADVFGVELHAADYPPFGDS